MMDFRQMAMMMLNKNPNITNNPQARNFFNIIENGDQRQGQQLAQNLCNTYGVTTQQAFEMAKQFFGIK